MVVYVPSPILRRRTTRPVVPPPIRNREVDPETGEPVFTETRLPPQAPPPAPPPIDPQPEIIQLGAFPDDESERVARQPYYRLPDGTLTQDRDLVESVYGGIEDQRAREDLREQLRENEFDRAEGVEEFAVLDRRLGEYNTRQQALVREVNQSLNLAQGRPELQREILEFHRDGIRELAEIYPEFRENAQENINQIETRLFRLDTPFPTASRGESAVTRQELATVRESIEVQRAAVDALRNQGASARALVSPELGGVFPLVPGGQRATNPALDNQLEILQEYYDQQDALLNQTDPGRVDRYTEFLEQGTSGRLGGPGFLDVGIGELTPANLSPSAQAAAAYETVTHPDSSGGAAVTPREASFLEQANIAYQAFGPFEALNVTGLASITRATPTTVRALLSNQGRRQIRQRLPGTTRQNILEEGVEQVGELGLETAVFGRPDFQGAAIESAVFIPAETFADVGRGVRPGPVISTSSFTQGTDAIRQNIIAVEDARVRAEAILAENPDNIQAQERVSSINSSLARLNQALASAELSASVNAATRSQVREARVPTPLTFGQRVALGPIGETLGIGATDPNPGFLARRYQLSNLPGAEQSMLLAGDVRQGFGSPGATVRGAVRGEANPGRLAAIGVPVVGLSSLVGPVQGTDVAVTAPPPVVSQTGASPRDRDVGVGPADPLGEVNPFDPDQTLAGDVSGLAAQGRGVVPPGITATPQAVQTPQAIQSVSPASPVAPASISQLSVSIQSAQDSLTNAIERADLADQNAPGINQEVARANLAAASQQVQEVALAAATQTQNAIQNQQVAQQQATVAVQQAQQTVAAAQQGIVSQAEATNAIQQAEIAELALNIQNEQVAVAQQQEQQAQQAAQQATTAQQQTATTTTTTTTTVARTPDDPAGARRRTQEQGRKPAGYIEEMKWKDDTADNTYNFRTRQHTIAAIDPEALRTLMTTKRSADNAGRGEHQAGSLKFSKGRSGVTARSRTRCLLYTSPSPRDS